MEPITKREVLIVGIQTIADSAYYGNVSAEQANATVQIIAEKLGFTMEEVNEIMTALAKKVNEVTSQNKKGVPGIG